MNLSALFWIHVMSVGALCTQLFSKIHDNRQPAKISYPFYDVLFLTVYAVIGDVQWQEDIEDFGEVYLAQLHDKELGAIQRAFIDHPHGQRLRRGQQTGVRLGNNRWRIQQNYRHSELLALLDIRQCLISIDAMGCQTAITKSIRQQGGDYLLAVKGNQFRLLEAVKQVLTPAMTTPLSTQTAALEQAHGRFDGRGYHVISAGELAARFADWDGLQSQGMAISYCIEKINK